MDPPLHEFLTHDDEKIKKVANIMGKSMSFVKTRMKSLEESNPMLGHRGCRLGISFPEIYKAQAKAIFQAASRLLHESGTVPSIEIMIPFIAYERGALI